MPWNGDDANGDTCLGCGRIKLACACEVRGSEGSGVLETNEDFLGTFSDGSGLTIDQISHPFPVRSPG